MSLGADPRLAAARCSSCPKMCRGVCPTLEVTRNERHQPWGHAHEVMAAQRSAEVGGPGFGDGLLTGAAYACATCGACTIPCEVEGVETPRLSWAVRAAVWEAGAAPPMAWRAVEEAAAGRVLVSDDPPAWDFPSATYAVLRSLSSRGAPLLFIAGCGTLGRRPQAAVAALQAIGACGVAAAVPATHRCCGAVARAMGDAAGAHRQAAALKLAAAEAGASRIVVQSPSCAQHLTDELREGAALQVTPLPVLLAEILSQAVPVVGAGGTAPTVTYHDPCFLARHLGLDAAPRAALRASGYAVSDLARNRGATRCSGRGGGLALTHPDIAAGYLALLAAEVVSSGAVTLVTGCASCASALAGVLPGVAVRELAEAIGEALPRSEAGS